MDPITHSLIGGLSAQTKGVSRRRFWIMCALGSVMDIDILANGLGDWATLLHHRGLTHSFLGMFVLVVFFAWVFKRFDSGPFLTRSFHYSLPMGLHLLTDYVTSFGVPLFSPFSLKSYSLGIVGSVNIVPMAVVALSLIAMVRKNQFGWKASGLAWGTLVVYLVLASFGKLLAMDIASDKTNLTAIPSLLNPLRWQAIGIDPSKNVYCEYSIDLLRRKVNHLKDIPMPKDDFPVKASMQAATVQKYLADSQWPMVRVNKSVHGWQVEWGRLIFSTRGLVRGNLLIQLDESGKILTESKIVSFWNPDVHS